MLATPRDHYEYIKKKGMDAFVTECLAENNKLKKMLASNFSRLILRKQESMKRHT